MIHSKIIVHSAIQHIFFTQSRVVVKSKLVRKERDSELTRRRTLWQNPLAEPSAAWWSRHDSRGKETGQWSRHQCYRHTHAYKSSPKKIVLLWHKTTSHLELNQLWYYGASTRYLMLYSGLERTNARIPALESDIPSLFSLGRRIPCHAPGLGRDKAPMFCLLQACTCLQKLPWQPHRKSCCFGTVPLHIRSWLNYDIMVYVIFDAKSKNEHYIICPWQRVRLAEAQRSESTPVYVFII